MKMYFNDVESGRAISIQQPFVEQILIGKRNMNTEVAQRKFVGGCFYMLR